MKLLYSFVFIIITIVLTNCSRKTQLSNFEKDFRSVKIEMSKPNLDYIRLKRKFMRDYMISAKTIRETDLKTDLELEAKSMKVGDVSQIQFDSDQSCGIIKVISKEKSEFVRFTSINLLENTEKVADDVIQKYNSGIDFNELADRYSKDNRNKDDSNWRSIKNFKIQLQSALRKHKAGEIYKVQGFDRQWLVVLQTHDTEMFPSVRIYKAKLKECTSR